MTNKPTIKDCMKQAQIFASAWGRVGSGVFGTTMGHATAEKEALEAMLRTALAAPAQPVTVPWENFPSYLIDHCEGDVISEEGLQFALSKMLSNPQYAPQPAAQTQTQEDVGGWRRAGALLYRLTGEHRPTNFDEIRVTMANGSRDIGQMSAQAERLLVMLTAPQPTAQPLHVAATSCPHEIDKDKIVLHFDSKQPGKNALAQLAARLQAAQAQPAVQTQRTGLCCRSHPHEKQGMQCQLLEVSAWLRWHASACTTPSADSMRLYADQVDAVTGSLLAAPAQAAAQAQHPDDAAVEKLAVMMKQKLAEKRAQGRSGWDTDCTQQRLSDLLRQHVEKGDVLDVANFCAFLFARGERVSAAQAQEDVPDMFWDADDTENFAHEIQDIVDGYGPGEIVTIECAKRLPNLRVVVTRDGDGLSYEYLEAAIVAQEGGAHG